MKFKGANMARPKIYSQPIKEWKIFEGDQVQMMQGKDTGKTGKVVSIVKKINSGNHSIFNYSVVVEGCHMVKL